MTKLDRPDDRGRFGEFGGRFAPETLMPALDELEQVFEQAPDYSCWRRVFWKYRPNSPLSSDASCRSTGKGSSSSFCRRLI